jgi:hypothetical protein
MKSQILLRPSNKSEENLILSSWLNSYRKAAPFNMCKTQIYYEFYRPLTMEVLSKSNVTVACWNEDQKLVYGYIVWRMFETIPIVSYIYVKSAFRSNGIANMLLESIGNHDVIVTTHMFPWLQESSERKKIVYNPFFDMRYLSWK